MPNENGRAYGLTLLCPLLNDAANDQSFASIVRDALRALPVEHLSPFARVPNTYLCRMFVLDDVFYQGKPAQEDHLRSKYLVMVVELHGDRDRWLRGMWKAAEGDIRQLWKHCVRFDRVQNEDDWLDYIKRCQVETTFYFMGSNDLPLNEQLKALYLKQELSHFAHENQGKSAAELQRAFTAFVQRVQPDDLTGPTWRAGAASLDKVVVG